MIIVEGSDNSGKSTLCRELHERTGMPLLDPGRGPMVDAQELWRRFNIVYLSNSGICDPSQQSICDRVSMLSEIVYQIALKRKILIPVSNIMGALRRLKGRHDPIIVYCRPPLDIIMCTDTHQIRENEDPEHIKNVHEHLSAIITGYDVLMARLTIERFRIVHYDYTAWAAETLVEEIIQCAG